MTRRDERGFHERVVENPTVLNDGEGFVYALTDWGAVKIGRSKGHPQVRLKQLQTGSSGELVLLGYTTGVLEKEVHKRLGTWRVRGEWFSICEAVLEEVGEWDWLDEMVWRQLWDLV